MTKAQYLLLNRKLQICVLGEFDETEGQALAESDWERVRLTLKCTMFILTLKA